MLSYGAAANSALGSNCVRVWSVESWDLVVCAWGCSRRCVRLLAHRGTGCATHQWFLRTFSFSSNAVHGSSLCGVPEGTAVPTCQRPDVAPRDEKAPAWQLAPLGNFVMCTYARSTCVTATGDCNATQGYQAQMVSCLESGTGTRCSLVVWPLAIRNGVLERFEEHTTRTLAIPALSGALVPAVQRLAAQYGHRSRVFAQRRARVFFAAERALRRCVRSGTPVGGFGFALAE